MSYITLKCKNCGANMSLNTESHSATCNHCSSTFLIADLLDEKDAAFVSKLSSKEIEQKMVASDALKKGETCLAKCDYENAETFFKKAIENDDSNFRSYLGVVKAKTQNLNKLPEDDDYLQYAHYALSLATGDDLVLVKSELSKIDLLVHEKRRQKRIFSSNQKREEKLRKHRKDVSKIFGVIAVFIVLMFGGFIFVSSMFTDIIFGTPQTIFTVSVDSYESLSSVLSNKKYLNYTINLTSDIDCQGNTIVPFGTQTESFSGTFNGNKYKISNAVIKNIDSGCVGLFGCTRLASINNLILDNVDIESTTTPTTTTMNYYGLLVGKSESTNISNIEIKNNCDVIFQKDIEYPIAIGGLAGAITNASYISNISSHAKIAATISQTTKSANSYIGGIVGLSSNSIINKTCSNSSISALITNSIKRISAAYMSGIVGYVANPTTVDVLNINHNHFSGKVTLSSSTFTTQMIGAIAGNNLKPTQQLNNSCLYTTTNFSHDSYTLPITKLSDYTENKYSVFFYTSNDQYLAKLSQDFSEWENSDTFEPSLV